MALTITSTTTDSEGAVVATTDSTPVATISFGRKNGLPNFSNEEFSMFLQIPLTDTSSPEAIEKQLDPQVAAVKAYVYKQLGVGFAVTENGVVASEVPVDRPKASKGGGGKPASAPKATSAEKEDLWARLAGAVVADGKIKDGNETVWDNRVGKKNPKGPDFKWADSGHALWLSDKPEWFSEPGAGITL